ncbi:hypothetical protein [Nocardia puris]|uniref:hypothetical protein n=1 Tax=Nocardia puris TaxID=208602 RepID=UPI002E1AD84A
MAQPVPGDYGIAAKATFLVGTVADRMKIRTESETVPAPNIKWDTLRLGRARSTYQCGKHTIAAVLLAEREIAALGGIRMQARRKARVLEDDNPIGGAGPSSRDLYQPNTVIPQDRQNMRDNQVTRTRPLVAGLRDHHHKVRQIIDELRWPETRFPDHSQQAGRTLHTHAIGPANRCRAFIEK